MIDKRHIDMIEYMLTGEYTMQQIADLIGVARNTLYTWLDRDDVKNEMDRRRQAIKTDASKKFDTKLDKAIDEYWSLATDPKTDRRTKQIALSYWIDRCLGRPVARTEMSDNRSDTNIDEDDILEDITEVEDDKVISIAN